MKGSLFTLAREHGDVTADNRGRVSYEFDGYGLRDYVRAIEAEVRAALSGAAPTPQPEHQQLMKFYGVTTLEALVDKQAHHVERLQAKLPPTPEVFAPQRVREG